MRSEEGLNSRLGGQRCDGRLSDDGQYAKHYLPGGYSINHFLTEKMDRLTASAMAW